MRTVIRSNKKRISLFVLSLLMSASAAAWHGHGGNWHGHGGWNGGPGYYRGGGYGFDSYGGGWGWGFPGPNIVINVPPPTYYVPECENVEVCNRYGRCWIERHCS